jgi:hypothetical protein
LGHRQANMPWKAVLPSLQSLPKGPRLTYQWMKDGVNIPNANAPAYAAPLLNYSANRAEFSVRVMNGAGQVVSDAAILCLERVGLTDPTTITAESTVVNVS